MKITNYKKYLYKDFFTKLSVYKNYSIRFFILKK